MPVEESSLHTWQQVCYRWSPVSFALENCGFVLFLLLNDSFVLFFFFFTHARFLISPCLLLLLLIWEQASKRKRLPELDASMELDLILCSSCGPGPSNFVLLFTWLFPHEPIGGFPTCFCLIPPRSIYSFPSPRLSLLGLSNIPSSRV